MFVSTIPVTDRLAKYILARGPPINVSGRLSLSINFNQLGILELGRHKAIRYLHLLPGLGIQSELIELEPIEKVRT